METKSKNGLGDHWSKQIVQTKYTHIYEKHSIIFRPLEKEQWLLLRQKTKIPSERERSMWIMHINCYCNKNLCEF